MSTFEKTDGSVVVKAADGRIVANMPAQKMPGSTSVMSVNWADIHAAVSERAAYAADTSTSWRERAEHLGISVEKLESALEEERTFYPANWGEASAHSAVDIPEARDALANWDFRGFRREVSWYATGIFWDRGGADVVDDIMQETGVEDEDLRPVIEQALDEDGAADPSEHWYACGERAHGMGVFGPTYGASNTASGVVIFDRAVRLLKERTDRDGYVIPETMTELNTLSVLARDEDNEFVFPMQDNPPYGPKLVISPELRDEILTADKAVLGEFQEQIMQGRVADVDGQAYTVSSFLNG